MCLLQVSLRAGRHTSGSGVWIALRVLGLHRQFHSVCCCVSQPCSGMTLTCGAPAQFLPPLFTTTVAAGVKHRANKHTSQTWRPTYIVLWMERAQVYVGLVC